MSKSKKNQTSTLWQVVIYPDQEEWKFPKRCPDGVQYMMGQLEITSTGRPHYQMFVRTKRPATTYQQVKKRLGSRTAHVESCYASAFRNYEYCSKENTRIEGPWEIGCHDIRTHEHVNVPVIQEDPELLHRIFISGLKIDPKVEEDAQVKHFEFWQGYDPRRAAVPEGREFTSEAS